MFRAKIYPKKNKYFTRIISVHQWKITCWWRVCYQRGLSPSSYGHFSEAVDFAYWWSCIGKGLRLQPAQQACFIVIYFSLFYFSNFLLFKLEKIIFFSFGLIFTFLFSLCQSCICDVRVCVLCMLFQQFLIACTTIGRWSWKFNSTFQCAQNILKVLVDSVFCMIAKHL